MLIDLLTLPLRLVLPHHDEPEDDLQLPQAESPAELMAALLQRSVTQDATAAKRDLAVATLNTLVPDEARIIAALAGGPPPPLLHVHPRAGGEPILENASLVGRSAALTLPSMTPSYVTHLRRLGLVEPGPEDPDGDYEMLMADRAVRAALTQGEFAKLPARTVKQTLTLSVRGRELWELCRS
jgi:hypothetical protein